MRIYLAARYSRRKELRGVREVLQAMGHVVTSRWLDTDWDRTPEGQSSAAPPEYRAKYAVIDLEDVESADAVVSFTEEPESGGGRGGRHVEHGYAMALKKRIYVVGHRENLFHEHPSTRFHEDVSSLLWDIGHAEL